MEVVRVTWSPQHGNELADKQVLVENPGTTGSVALVSHSFSPRTGLPPPLTKSKVMSRSPAVRLIVTGPVVVPDQGSLFVPQGGVVVPVTHVVFWLISKSMFALP